MRKWNFIAPVFLGFFLVGCETTTIIEIEQCQPGSGAPKATIIGLPTAMTEAEKELSIDSFLRKNIDIIERNGKTLDDAKRSLTAYKSAEYIRAPRPSHPPSARDTGQQAVCEVQFDVTATGETTNIEAYCSSPEYISFAERAVQQTKFKPALLYGEPVTQLKVIQPIEFCSNR